MLARFPPVKRRLGGVSAALVLLASLSWASPTVPPPCADAETPPSLDPLPLELWPEGAPGALGDAAKDRPRILLHRPAEANGTAIVVCPGGGYGHLAMEHEGRMVAAWLNELGITAAILEYRHAGKGYGHPAPLRDVQRALRLVRHRAEEWSLDPERLGVLGFSAGGHLAATAATLFDARVADDGRFAEPADPPHEASVTERTGDPIDARSARPNFAVLVYPVILTDGPHAHGGSRRNLLGESPDPTQLAWLSPANQVSPKTPPTFLVHADDDRGVPPENSIAFYTACRQQRVASELHIYRRGGHGFGMRRKGLPVEEWPGQCAVWMQEIGVLSGDE